MKIELKQIIPGPLPAPLVTASQIWGKDLTLKEGQSILAYAPSGKGKSTLLHILYGLRNDFKGSFLLGNSLSGEHTFENWQEWRSQKLSILFQDLRLFPHLTARENLDLLPVLSPHAPPVEEWGERLEVSALLDQKISTLSLGQRQRIALIRCLRKPFRWLFLDEPFSHLDRPNTELAVRLIEEVRQKNGAGLILTSLQEISPLVCDRSIQL